MTSAWVGSDGMNFTRVALAALAAWVAFVVVGSFVHSAMLDGLYPRRPGLGPGTVGQSTGFAVVLPHRVAHGLALLDETMGLSVASRATGQYGIAAQGAKGGWVRNRFWCDDQHLGLLLHPTQTHLEDEPQNQTLSNMISKH